MNARYLLLLAIGALLVLVAASYQPDGPTWEYEIVQARVSSDLFTEGSAPPTLHQVAKDKANALAAEGWMLDGITAMEREGQRPMLYLAFKRQVQ